MTYYPAGICYLAFLLLALASPFLPLRFIGTTIALAALSYASGRLIEGPTHWSNQDFGYTVGALIIQAFVGAVAAAVVLRLAIEAAFGRLWRPMSSGHKAQVRAYCHVALMAAGLVAGLVSAMGLAELFNSTSGGWYLDLGIALLAAGSAVIAIQRLPMFQAAPVAALCLTLTVIAAVGSGQSGRIVRQAEAYAKGRPWCLVGPNGTPPITSSLQLGFFSLPKGRGYPHIAVRVQGGEERDGAHWSIRRQSIEQGWGTGIAFCRPQDDYGTALRNGRLKPK